MEQEQALDIAETAVELHAAVLNWRPFLPEEKTDLKDQESGWNILYETLKDKVGGFPGVNRLIVEAAHCCWCIMPDTADYEHQEAIVIYADCIVKSVRYWGDWPSDEELTGAAEHAIRSATD